MRRLIFIVIGLSMAMVVPFFSGARHGIGPPIKL
jgi:hypothetical protein